MELQRMEEALENQLDINEGRLLSLFRKLVETDSPSGSERAVCDSLKKELEACGVSAQEDDAGARTGGNAGNLYAYIDGDTALPPLLFSAHMDTVEPSEKKKCIMDSDGTIHSDGTTVLGADDFAGVCAILEAVCTVQERRLSHRPIELLFSVSEETYCRGMAVFDFRKLKAREAYVFDLSGSVGNAAYAAPTILSFEVQLTGKASHAGFAPQQGIHAIQAAALAALKIRCGQIDEDTTVNIGRIQGGTANNIVPETCVFTGEIRSYSDEKALAQYRLLADSVRQAASEFHAEARIGYTRHITAYETDCRHSVVQRFRKVCRSLQLEPCLLRSFGGSDNNVFAQNGISGIVAATAMNACHTTNEWTTKAELKKAAQLALGLMTAKE